MAVSYGFHATMTARPGLGERLAELLLTGLDRGNPGADEHCLVYLVSRSAADPDRVHVVEGWTSEADHHRVFAGEPARALLARVGELLAGEAEFSDLVPVGGRAAAH
ncbi:putative quinol monooxygenase [Kitasatospora purpeofusca]|uniref:putative quinol monooxygenase n=1 Tax=Kitasatospora purpeofusca TaxID=67352 RepID=UPI0004C2173B|nr:antibiotic biosynthesis monooxygenase [Kitasatospora purpeofusca]